MRRSASAASTPKEHVQNNQGQNVGERAERPYLFGVLFVRSLRRRFPRVHMPMRAFGAFLGSVLLLAIGAVPATAQWENIETVEGSYGSDMTLTKRPHSVAEGLSVRALAIGRSDTTRWALSLIGAAPDDDISIAFGDESLSIQDVQRPSDGVGPTKVFVSKEAFLTMAETQTVRLRVGDVTAPLPEQLRREMKEIFRRAS